MQAVSNAGTIPNPYVEKIHYIDAEPAGHVHELDVKLLSLCGSGFSLFAVHVVAKPHITHS